MIDFRTDELKNEARLTDALDEHTPQLLRYRQALRMIPGTDPRCEIWLPGRCGAVCYVSPGQGAEFPDDADLRPAEDAYEDEELFPPFEDGSPDAVLFDPAF